MASLQGLDARLSRAAKLLDQAAYEIRRLRLSAPRNVLRVAEALQRISEIQFEIYTKRPGLVPASLRNTVRIAGKETASKRRRRSARRSRGRR
jgi:hypothetical protein